MRVCELMKIFDPYETVGFYRFVPGTDKNFLKDQKQISYGDNVKDLEHEPWYKRIKELPVIHAEAVDSYYGADQGFMGIAVVFYRSDDDERNRLDASD